MFDIFRMSPQKKNITEKKKKEGKTAKNEVQNLEEILFGRAVCVNGPVVH